MEEGKMNKGQGLIEYVLILVLVVTVIIVLAALLFPISKPPCDDPYPTAGKIVSCIATRTAEAHNK